MKKQSRNTIAKKEILQLIQKAGSALSHSEIQHLLDDLCDRVTIYRVLDRLVEEGQIHKVLTIDGKIKYAKCNGCGTVHRHNHIHFNCENCQTVTCLDDIQPMFDLPKNYQISQVNFTVSGLCPSCS